MRRELAVLVRAVAREAARRSVRALARVQETSILRSQLDTSGTGERTSAQRGVLVVLRVEGPRGVGSAEEWLGSAEAAPSRALVRGALAAARVADGGTLEGALEGPSTLRPAQGRLRGASGAPLRSGRAVDVFEAARAGAGRAALMLDATFERTESVFAYSERGEERFHAASLARVSAHGEVSHGESSAQLGFSEEIRRESDWRRVLEAAREAAHDAARRARDRSEPEAIGRPRLLLLSPDVVTWILRGPVVDGFALARPGARALVPPWLEVDDAGSASPDEQGIVARPAALVRRGAWVRGPFLAFDGSGRTRRDPRRSVPEAALASLVFRPAPSLARSRARLLARVPALLGEVASADPLPGGAVHLAAHGARRVRGRWRATGLVSVRVDPRQLGRALAASTDLEPVWAHDLLVRAPWVLVRGLALRT